MTAIHSTCNVKSLTRWVRRSDKLLHLDVSGVLKTSKQVRSLIKAVKKQGTILAVHLNDTPVISLDKSLQNYIKRKLSLDRDLFAPENYP